MAKLAFQFQIDLIKAGKSTTDEIFYSKFHEVILKTSGPLWDPCLEAPLDEGGAEISHTTALHLLGRI